MALFNFRKAKVFARLPFMILVAISAIGLLYPYGSQPFLAVLFYFLFSYSIMTLLRTLWCLLKFNSWDSQQLQETILHKMDPEQASSNTHLIVIATYKESITELMATVENLSVLRQAKQITICLALEKRDTAAIGKAQQIISKFSDYFHLVTYSVHEDQKGEVIGKGSNVASLFKKLVLSDTVKAVEKWDLIHILDVDTHHSQDYFDRIETIWFKTPLEDRKKLFFSCPIAFNRNCKQVAWPVRTIDNFWALAGISSLYPGSNFTTPISTYSLSLELAIRMDGWDADSFGIGEDYHSAVKAHCKSSGDVLMRPIYAPASSLNVTRERVAMTTWIGDLYARYQQGCRHLWGILSISYMLEQYIDKLSILKKWKSWVVLCRTMEPCFLVWVYPVSWLYLRHSYTVLELVAATWINGLWTPLAYGLLAYVVFSKWQIKISRLEVICTMMALVVLSPIIIICSTTLPALNASFRHLFYLEYRGWVTPGANAKNVPQPDQEQMTTESDQDQNQCDVFSERSQLNIPNSP